MDGNPKQAVAEKIRSSNSVLVSVSKNPSVDQLASALGLSLMLDKLGKHTTTVFSGDIPNTMEFLEPEKTFDSTVDGLRDFIISLDKEKADKLRYKVEDSVVKIFITPYKTKLSADDLNFTQGDYNVDLVIGLGVHKREDMDEAITSHGRILHDATIITINDGGKGSSLGSVDWTDENASSLAEMLVSISEALEGGILDKQMSTAFLTAIVASTDRFKNDKTSPKVMTMAAQLMAAGANQQQIAQNLQIDVPEPKVKKPEPKEEPQSDLEDSFEIEREPKKEKKKDHPKPEQDEEAEEPETKLPEISDDDTLKEIEQSVDSPHIQASKPQIDHDEDPAIKELEDELEDSGDETLAQLEKELHATHPTFDTENNKDTNNSSPINHVKSLDSSAEVKDSKPSMGGTFNATAEQAHDEDERRQRGDSSTSILSHGAPTSKARDIDANFHEVQAVQEAPAADDLQQQIEQARRDVDAAMNGAAFAPEGQPIAALNAAPLPMDGGDMGQYGQQMPPPPTISTPMQQQQPQDLPQMAHFGEPNPIAQEAMQQAQQPMQMPPQQPQQQQMPQQPMQNPLYNQMQPPQQPAMTQQMPPQQQQMYQQAQQQMPPPMNTPPSGPPPMPPNIPPPMPMQ